MKMKRFLVVLAIFVSYLLGVSILSQVTGETWNNTNVFWNDIRAYPLWVNMISMITISMGTLLIYFVPGIFIVQSAVNRNDALELFAKGFLCNYFFYFFVTTILKVAFHLPITKGLMTIIIGIYALLAGLLMHLKNKYREQELTFGLKDLKDKRFIVLFFAVLCILFFDYREKILSDEI